MKTARMKAQTLAAAQLTESQLALADLALTKDRHGLSQRQMLDLAGVDHKGTTAIARYSQTIRRKAVATYIEVMRSSAIKRTTLSLTYLDGELDKMIRSADLTKVLKFKNNRILLKGNPRKLPRKVRMMIKEIKPTKYGLSVLLYSRPELIRMAYQRHGALTDKQALVGPGDGPIETRALDKEEYREVRQEMIDTDDC